MLASEQKGGKHFIFSYLAESITSLHTARRLIRAKTVLQEGFNPCEDGVFVV